MKLPPQRYPGYYSVPKMLLERFCTDKVSVRVNKVLGNGKKSPAKDESPPGSRSISDDR